MHLKVTVSLMVLLIAVFVEGADNKREYVVELSKKKAKSLKYLLVAILGALLSKSLVFLLAFKVMAVVIAISVPIIGTTIKAMFNVDHASVSSSGLAHMLKGDDLKGVEHQQPASHLQYWGQNQGYQRRRHKDYAH